MAKRLVAADASPLIGLAAAGAFDLLRQLFGTITVTAAVHDEVMAGKSLPGAAELAGAIEVGWIEVVPTPAGIDRFPELDAGEASVLALSLNHGSGCLVLMDEPAGRRQARAHGFFVTGLAGVLLASRRAGIVKRVKPYFDRLADSNFRISNEIVDAVLEEAGEA